jgi:uncharacterized protein (DUF697 family)
MSKRTDALAAVLQHAVGNGGVAAVPTPGVETGKHLIYSGNEIAMCLRIGHIYFGSHLTADDVREMLVNNGLAASTGAGLAVVGTKIGQTVTDEVLNVFGPVGWAFKAVLCGSITASLGWAFVKICENLDS